MNNELIQSFQQAQQVLTDFCSNTSKLDRVADVAKQIAQCMRDGGKVIACGNGGSACDAMHFAEEFAGRYRKDRRALAAMSLTDPGFLTCAANDFGYERVFARGVEAYGKEGDWLIILSTSGNSENVLAAAQQARLLKVKTFALIGKDGGRLKGECDYEIIVPGETTDRIQELHMLILHIIVEGVERELFPEHYS